MQEKLRVDKYLWAIRIFKTRSLASAACESGKVKLNGNPCKAAKNVQTDDEYTIKTETRNWVIKVSGLLHNRVAYSEAIKYYVDLTPEEDLQLVKNTTSSFHTGKRLSKIGRPTKKERRDLDDYFNDQ